jgi:hypothetical protein
MTCAVDVQGERSKGVRFIYKQQAAAQHNHMLMLTCDADLAHLYVARLQNARMLRAPLPAATARRPNTIIFQHVITASVLLLLAAHLPRMPAAPAAAMPDIVVPGPPASHEGIAQRVLEASQQEGSPGWLSSAACCCVVAGCLAGASICCRVVEGTRRGLAAVALTSIRRTCRVLNEPFC